MKILKLQKISTCLFSTIKMAPKVPQIKQIKQEWNQFSAGYSKFDLGPQTFYYSFLTLMQLSQAKNILQVACGSGKLLPVAIQLKKAETKYTAVDLSKNMVQLAKSNLKQNFHKYQSKLTFQEWCAKQNMEILEANAEQKFVHKQKFDRIICNCVMMLTQNPQIMLKNLYEHAEQGCLMGISVWGNKSQNNLMSSIRSAILQSGFALPNERSNFHLYRKLGPLAQKIGWKTKLNWQQNSLFPLNQFCPKKYQQLFLHQINKMPLQQREPIRKILYEKVAEIFKQKKGLNFSCELFLFQK